MGPGAEESREHSYRQHKKVECYLQCLVRNLVFSCWKSLFVMKTCFQQWQEEEMGRRNPHREQWSSPTRKIKKEGNATRKIQEEQAWKIWKEGVTVTWTQYWQDYMCDLENLGYLGLNCKPMSVTVRLDSLFLLFCVKFYSLYAVTCCKNNFAPLDCVTLHRYCQQNKASHFSLIK